MVTPSRSRASLKAFVRVEADWVGRGSSRSAKLSTHVLGQGVTRREPVFVLSWISIQLSSSQVSAAHSWGAESVGRAHAEGPAPVRLADLLERGLDGLVGGDVALGELVDAVAAAGIEEGGGF